MANIKTAKKMILVHAKRRLHNRSVRSQIRTAFKKAAECMTSPEHAVEAAREAFSTISRAASKGVVHKNKAARRTSRLAKKLNAALTKA